MNLLIKGPIGAAILAGAAALLGPAEGIAQASERNFAHEAMREGNVAHEPAGSTAAGYNAGQVCNPPFNVPTVKPSRVLSKPNFAVIYWNGNVWPELVNNAPLFYSDLDQPGSTYLNSLTSDYGVSTGIYRGATTITPRQAVTCNGGTCVLGELQINSELASQIANNTSNIPTPEGDGVSGGYANNLLYLVHLPPNYLLTQIPQSGTVTVTNGSANVVFSNPQSFGALQGVVFSAQPTTLYFIQATTNNSTNATLTTAYTGPNSTTGTIAQQQCGFHDEMRDNRGNTAAVAYMADMSPGSLCSGQQNWTNLGPIVDAFEMASHEVIEAAVRPFPRTLTPNNGEIGDYCQCSNKYSGYPGINRPVAFTTFAGFWRTWEVQQPYLLSTKACQTMQIFPSTAQNASNSSGFAIAPTSTSLSEFWAPTNGTLNWSSWSSGNSWSDSNAYTGGPVVAGSQIAATSRDPLNYDLFYIGSDGNVYTTAIGLFSVNTSNLTGAGGAIAGANFPAPPGKGISAFASGSGGLDVLFVDNNGNLHGLGWSSGAVGNGWSVYLTDPLASGITPGASVAAIKRSNLNTDIFFIGLDGGIWQMSTQGILGSWSRSEVPGTAGLAKAGGSIAAVARTWDKIDVFFFDNSGNAKQASWSEDTNVWSISTTAGTATASAQIAAVTRSPFNLDTFFVDGGGVGNVSWHHWGDANADKWGLARVLANTEGLTFPLGESIAATTRLPTNLDVFELNSAGTSYTEFWSGGSWGNLPN